uniref:Plasma membrane calcium transporting P-type ATPase C-terminal domain-containing protein n=1 Tax=Glossina austeni TaxID=7395 RepID=A0A1A9UDA4_GLOAU
MNLGEERFDSIDSDKKPRAGQILWIRGLTRLQTQLFFYLLFYDLRKKNVRYFHICQFLFKLLTIKKLANCIWQGIRVWNIEGKVLIS